MRVECADAPEFVVSDLPIERCPLVRNEEGEACIVWENVEPGVLYRSGGRFWRAYYWGVGQDGKMYVFTPFWPGWLFRGAGRYSIYSRKEATP